MPHTAQRAPDTHDGWHAALALRFERREARTVLAHRAHVGPLQVQRPFYPEGPGVPHVYVLHPPGGVVGGDRLEIDIEAADGAHALVTAPAAGKFYRSAGAVATLRQRLRVGSDAMVEWLPQETIVYDGARAHGALIVELAPQARCIAWEIVCLGRPGAGEVFTHGAFRQDIEVWRDGGPVLLERAHCEGSMLDAAWGLAGHPVTATLVVTPCGDEAVSALRSGIGTMPFAARAAVTLIDGVLVCRYVGEEVQEARVLCHRAWELLRPPLAGRPACAPRVWAT